VASIVLKKNIKLAPVLRDGIMVGVISRTHLLEHMLQEEDIEDDSIFEDM
jgi:predicted transcriptional regulator